MKKMNFKSSESLDSVRKIINEANEALKNPIRVIKDSAIPEVLAGALGSMVGGAGSFAALYFGGSVVGLSAAGISSGLAAAGSLVGGGMAAGIGVLAAPVAILGAGAIYGVHTYKSKKLEQEKHRLYQEALKKHAAIIDKLKNEANISKERADYLQSLNIMLQRAIEDLKEDLSRNGKVQLYKR